MPMFPLGTVLLPGGLLPLRLFEPRYLEMLQDVLQAEEPEIGFVLIERGHEAGGGDARFSTATVGRIVQAEPRETDVGMVVQGGRRVEVEGWLPEDPYPRARVRDLPDLVPDVDRAEVAAVHDRAVAASLRLGIMAPEPPPHGLLAACWHLADACPLGPYDRLALLRSTRARQLLAAVDDAYDQAVQMHEAFGPGS
ncbi:LON peptidase substrate-binding domain-containing protein [Aeromicrobium sp.]|uniref:LON peptidase substrate-binding domain-containing protein n=1 Tax=Aeromicrobium sp. TaxID=1871063 RepID=UPI0040348BAB